MKLILILFDPLNIQGREPYPLMWAKKAKLELWLVFTNLYIYRPMGKSRNFGVHVLVNVCTNFDKIQYAATSCCFVEICEKQKPKNNPTSPHPPNKNRKKMYYSRERTLVRRFCERYMYSLIQA